MHSIVAALEKASYDENGQHELPERHRHHDGCYRLLWELLLDLFRVASLQTRAARMQACIDHEWIRSDEVFPFSFVWTCQHLGLDAAVVRTAYFSGVVIATGYDVYHRPPVRLPDLHLCPGCGEETD